MKFLREYWPFGALILVFGVLIVMIELRRKNLPQGHDYYMTFTYQTKDGDESTQQIVLAFKRLDADAILTAQEFVKTNHGRTNISAVILLNAIKLDR